MRAVDIHEARSKFLLLIIKEKLLYLIKQLHIEQQLTFRCIKDNIITY